MVDIQEKLLPPIFNKEALVKNSQLLIRLAKILDLPIIVDHAVQQRSGPNGAGDRFPAGGRHRHSTRLEFSCFGSDQFRSRLKALPGNRNTVLLCGMEAHICVMQTALGALNEGYLVHVASDAVGSRAEWNWKIGLERMKSAGAVISSTEMMMYELLRCSGTAAVQGIAAVFEVTPTGDQPDRTHIVAFHRFLIALSSDS